MNSVPQFPSGTVAMNMDSASEMWELKTEAPVIEADAYTYMREREKQQQNYIDTSNPRLTSPERGATIERMFIVAHHLSLGWTTRASAVAYFDRCLCCMPTIPVNALSLLAMGSLLVASKMEEEEISVPTVSSVLRAAGSSASMQDLNIMELLILKIWGWNACVVTPMHFVPFFARIAQVYDENIDASGNIDGMHHNIKPEKTSIDVVITDPVAQLACCIAEAASLNVQTMGFPPSILAASCVAVARKNHNISPHWPHTLSAIAGFPPSNDTAPPIVLECCSRLLRVCQLQPARPALRGQMPPLYADAAVVAPSPSSKVDPAWGAAASSTHRVQNNLPSHVGMATSLHHGPHAS
eukprot:m.308862 g.308862  ORF g.308862 m.308862 type:complete len:354 (-) comp20194_c0_seq3:90-1151(-)